MPLRNALPKTLALVSLSVGFAACGTRGSSPGPCEGAPCSAEVELAATEDLPTYFQNKFGLDLNDVYWGDMHTHSHYSADADGLAGNAPTVTPATVYQRARAKGFAFSAVTDHAEAPVPANIVPNSGANVWESTRSLSNAANDELLDGNGVFIPFMGYEYTNPFPSTDPAKCPSTCTYAQQSQSCTGYGHKNVVFESIAGAPTKRLSFLDPSLWTVTSGCTGSAPSPYCGFSSYSVSAPDNPSAWSWLRSKGYAGPSDGPSTALTIIHTPGNIHHNDWGVIDEAFVRNVEIFSQWGNSEGKPPASCAIQDDLAVSLPAEALNDESLLIRPQIQSKWIVGGDPRYALGFVAGSDDHSANPGGDGNGNGGVTGIFTPAPSRHAFFEGLWKRRTIAATYYANMAPLTVLSAAETGTTNLFGGDVGTIDPSGKVKVRVLASAGTSEIQVVVDGCTRPATTGTSRTLDLTLSARTRHYIYVRARRPSATSDAGAAATDFHQTWSSPIYLRPSL